MGFYRKNIGRGQQIVRIAIGVAAATAALMLLGAPFGILGAIAAAVFAVTGVVGYCPLCAVAGIAARDSR